MAVAVPLGVVAIAAATWADQGPAVPLAALTSVEATSDATADGESRPDFLVSFGDAHLRGRIDLDHLLLEGERFVAPLGDGERAVLTLDADVQARAERVLLDADALYAAVVVMAIDGRILALATRSSAEPELGAADLALRPWAPAASVFKIVTSAALLERGVAPDTQVCYHGGLRSIDTSNLVDDPRRDTVCQSFTFGLAHSQNAIIGKLAARHLDAAGLRRAAASFGFGQAPRFALAATPSTATIPEEPLAFARVAAGFWETYLSPLGGALLANTVASGGLSVTPRIVASTVDAAGVERPILAAAPRRVLSPETAGALAAMLTETTRGGTARLAFSDPRGRPYLPGVPVAGKTGSLSRPSPYLHYSWFVGFAPADSPQVVVSVLIGNSPTWRLKAHTAARLVLETALAR